MRALYLLLPKSKAVDADKHSMDDKWQALEARNKRESRHQTSVTFRD